MEAGRGRRRDGRGDLAAVPRRVQDPGGAAGERRARSAPAPAPAPTPASAPAPSNGSLFPWWQPAPQTTTAAPTGAGQFQTQAQAQARCPADKVVWVNLSSRVYHYQGTRYYGGTKRGAFMCEADARAAGDRAAKENFARPKQQS